MQKKPQAVGSRPYINEADSPLWNAIKRLKSAKRRKASAKMIERLEQRVKDEAEKVNERLGGQSVGDIVDRLEKGTSRGE